VRRPSSSVMLASRSLARKCANAWPVACGVAKEPDVSVRESDPSHRASFVCRPAAFAIHTLDTILINGWICKQEVELFSKMDLIRVKWHGGIYEATCASLGLSHHNKYRNETNKPSG